MFDYKAHLLQSIRCIEGGLYRHQCDNCFYQEIKACLEKVPESNGSKIYHKIPISVGIIADEFVFENYRDTCTLHYISRYSWEETISEIQALVVTSTWHGLDDSWVGIYKNNSASYESLRKLCKAVHKKEIPIVFYSKEDPPNYHVFYHLADFADIIFTSAVECVDRYKNQYPTKKCGCLSFGVNPILHNPIRNKTEFVFDKAMFAGSYMTKYPKRTKEQELLFDFIKRFGVELTIIDRNYTRNNSTYFYPKRYRKYVVNNFTYREVAKIYKLFQYVINLNSVYDSKTMFSSRVYDALACGSLLISNESTGMKSIFPLVSVTETEISNLMSSKNTYDLRKIAVRTAMKEKTVFENMYTILQNVGFSFLGFSMPTVDVIVPNERCNIEEIKDQSYKNIKICKTEDDSNSECALYWDSDEHYDKYFIEDLITGFKYTDTDFVCQAQQNHFQYTSKIDTKHRTLFWKKDNPDYKLGSMNGFQI